jgi:hypothetical protein
VLALVALNGCIILRRVRPDVCERQRVRRRGVRLRGGRDAVRRPVRLGADRPRELRRVRHRVRPRRGVRSGLVRPPRYRLRRRDRVRERRLLGDVRRDAGHDALRGVLRRHAARRQQLRRVRAAGVRAAFAR